MKASVIRPAAPNSVRPRPGETSTAFGERLRSRIAECRSRPRAVELGSVPCRGMPANGSLQRDRSDGPFAGPVVHPPSTGMLTSMLA